MEMRAAEKRNGFSATESRLTSGDFAAAIRGVASEYKKFRSKRFGIFSQPNF
jgi:hypothetical protein